MTNKLANEQNEICFSLKIEQVLTDAKNAVNKCDFHLPFANAMKSKMKTFENAAQ